MDLHKQSTPACNKISCSSVPTLLIELRNKNQDTLDLLPITNKPKTDNNDQAGIIYEHSGL